MVDPIKHTIPKVTQNFVAYPSPKVNSTDASIIFHMTYFDIWTNFSNLHSSARPLAVGEVESKPLVPQEISSILQREYILRTIRYVGV